MFMHFLDKRFPTIGNKWFTQDECLLSKTLLGQHLTNQNCKTTEQVTHLNTPVWLACYRLRDHVRIKSKQNMPHTAAQSANTP